MTREAYLSLNKDQQLQARKAMGHAAYLTLMRSRELTQQEKEAGRSSMERAKATGAFSASIAAMIKQVR